MLVAGTLLAIAATLSRSAGAAQPPPPARFASQAVSFSYPAAWQQHSWPWSFSFSSLITYLSTTALHDPCTRSALELHCGAPLASLPAKGVLVTWTLNGFPGWSLARASGKAMRVDGRAARLSQRQSPDCTALGATRTLTAVIAGAVRDNFLRMEACLRGPKLGLGARQVRQMLESVRFS